MSATLMTFPVVRWTIMGISDGQPLAGTSMRAAQAYQAMTSAEWRTSPAAASIPAHHYDAAAPANGDAYKQTWGYDEASRTERSACGAVCYTVAIPYDALTGADCMIEEVSATLYGDRYLADGAILTVLASPLATPPPFDELVSSGTSSQALLIPATTDADDQQLPPNKRPDTTAAATVAMPTSTAATRYLHILLRCADYLSVRGAWHEGGAMLDAATIAITFSRVVAPDGPMFALNVPAVKYVDTEPYSTDGACAFGIMVPNMDMWVHGDPDAWSPTPQRLRHLLAGRLVPCVVPGFLDNNRCCGGHWVIPHGFPDLTPGNVTAAGSAVNTGWVGYKLLQDESHECLAPHQMAAACVYSVLPGARAEFHCLSAPMVSLGESISLRLLAYSMDGVPTSNQSQNAYGVSSSNTHPLVACAPCASALDYLGLFSGRLESLPYTHCEALNFIAGAIMPTEPGGTSLFSRPCRFLGSWTVEADIAAGQRFTFDEPYVVDEAALLMLVAVPTSYSRAAIPSTLSDCAIEWPLAGWALD